jgi:hypothetical protein
MTGMAPSALASHASTAYCLSSKLWDLAAKFASLTLPDMSQLGPDRDVGQARELSS